MKIARLSILLTALACALFAGAAASARQAAPQGQAPAPAPRQTPTPQREEVEEGVTARVVRVPVTVLDKKGVPVTGLTRNDFQVFEEKRPVQFDFLAALESA